MSFASDVETRPLLKVNSSEPPSGTDAVTPLKVTLSFRNLTYEVVMKKEKTTQRILKGATGYVHSGQLMAILGPSGAGKTTMLDILAQRQKSGEVCGELKVNGHAVDTGVFRRVSAYVQQEDILHGFLTVRETISYAAQLRLPGNVSAEERARRVQEIMQMLGIDHIADRRIGSETVRGISGGEKKRTAIAVELVTSPSLIFLDEPTTGLDTFTAMHLVYVLKRLASLGATVVFSIHQPRAGIFELFDTVLVLNGCGEQAYFGPASQAVSFYESAGVRPTRTENPADFLLDSVSIVRASEELDKSDFPFMPPTGQAELIAREFMTSSRMTDAHKYIEGIDRLYSADPQLPAALSSPYPRSFLVQVGVVSQRAFVNKMRDPMATIVAVFTAIMFAVLIGSIFYQLGLDMSGSQDRLGVLFFLTMNTAFSNLGSLALFLFDRSIYQREHSNAMYRPSAYYIGKIVQDVPFGIVVNLVFNAIAYYMIGLQNSAEKFFKFFFINTLVMLNSYGMCMFVSSFSKNYQVANLIAPLILVLYLIPSGFLISLNSIPVFWRWIKYISFFRYGYEAVVINEFEGLTFHVSNCNTTTVEGLACNFTGAAYIEQNLGFSVDDFSMDIGAVGGSVLVYLFLGYFFLRLFRGKEAK